MTGPGDRSLWDRQPRPPDQADGRPGDQNREWVWPTTTPLADLRRRDRLRRKGAGNGDE